RAPRRRHRPRRGRPPRAAASRLGAGAPRAPPPDPPGDDAARGRPRAAPLRGRVTLDLDRLLEGSSRTFALSIPLLPEPTRRQVGIAYLLFRIADTFEDAAVWPAERRIAALAEFRALLDSPERGTAEAAVRRWMDGPPTAHAGYRTLLAETP